MINQPIIFNSSSTNYITSATTTVINGSFTCSSAGTIVGMHGLTIETSYQTSKNKVLKHAQDGTPLFKIASEDDEVFCITVCYNDEQLCQDIPVEFDLDEGSLLDLAFEIFPEIFKSIQEWLDSCDQLIKFVYTIENVEFTMTVEDFRKL